MKRKTGQFIAEDEKGCRYTILILTNVVRAGTVENPGEEIEEKTELKTFEGMAVDRLEQGKYRIVPTGTVVQSASRDAS